jgi:two-component system chemotaxis response regulator CheB
MAQATYSAVVMGASAGALEALTAILPVLPKDFPLPIMLVVHLPPNKDSTLADLLRFKCKLDVYEAEDKAPIEPGAIYIAPPNYHLLVEPDYHLSLSSDEPVMFSRPSIDVLFETAAEAYGEKLIGVVLTGANNDGSKGIRKICEYGGTAFVQDPETASAPQMPQAALKACATAQSLTLEQIAACLQKVATYG